MSLMVIVMLSGFFSMKPVVGGRVLGDHNNSNENNDNRRDNDKEESAVTETVTISPAEMIVKEKEFTPGLTLTVTPVLKELPAEEEREVPKEEVKMYVNQNHEALQVVPITQRSEVEEISSVPQVVVTQTVVQTLKTKIQQLSRGSGVIVPVKKNPTPLPTVKTKEAEIDVLSGDVALVYRNSNGKVFLVAEDNEGRVLKINEGEMRRVEVTTDSKLKKTGISLGVTADGRFVIEKNGVSAVISYPASISLGSNSITVITPYGEKELKLLPDAAISEVLSVNSYKELSGMVLDLDLKGVDLKYKVEGLKQYKLFGYFPVEVRERTFISAESGEVIRSDQLPLTNLIKLLSVW